MLAGAIAILLASLTAVAQDQFQFVVSAVDGEGKPVTDLKPEDVLMSENGVNAQILKVEPFRMPVKLTLVVDNGPLSRENLTQLRSGLEGLVKALPSGEVEIALISIAPQPRRVVPPTTDPQRVLQGIKNIGPEEARPRFTDAFVEFSKRFQDELQKTKRVDSLPVLVMVSTTAPQTSNYQPSDLDKALAFLQARKARVYVVMTTARQNAVGFSAINSVSQAIVAMPATKATRGRYETLPDSRQVETMLPEFGAEIAALHNKHYNQLLVTAKRQATGPLQNPRVELARPGLTGLVSLDGLP
jgi:hypothetical protein